MQYQKKYLSEGLIQVAILLSLCEFWMNVGLKPCLPHTLFEMIQGPTSVLTKTEVHNLCNRLEDTKSLNSKNVDLDGVFTPHQLFGWIRSLNRLQIPHVEVETWLVQRERDPFPVGQEHQFFLLEERRNHMTPTVEPRPNLEEENEEEHRLGDPGGRHADSDTQHVPPDGRSMDLEVQWQDLLSILEAENLNMNSRPDGNVPAVGSDGNVVLQLDEQNLLTTTTSEHDLLRTGNQSELGSALLPLIPSSELDIPIILPAENSFIDFEPEDNLNNVQMDLLSPPLMDMLTPENLSEFDMDFSLNDPIIPRFIPTLDGDDLRQDLQGPSGANLFDEQDSGGHCSPLGNLLEDLSILDPIRGWRPVQEDGFLQGMAARPLEKSCDDCRGSQPGINRKDKKHSDDEDETESNSRSPASSYVFEESPSSASFSLSTSSSSGSAEGSLFSENEDEEAKDFFGLEMEVEVTIKEEHLEEEEFGAVGGSPRDAKHLLPVRKSRNPELFSGTSGEEYIDHDHTYNQAWLPSPPIQDMHPKPTKSQQSSSSFLSEPKFCGRDERQARALKIPFSNQLIVNLPVEEFNDLLSRVQLNEEQLSLVRDIRRRGKNKIAAQNCRKRKQDVLLGLKDDVLGLRRHHAQLLKERKEALRKLQEMKNRLKMVSEEISKYRNEEGEPLNLPEYDFHFGSFNDDAAAMADKNSKKSRRKK